MSVKEKKARRLRFRKNMREKTDYVNCHGDQPEPNMITLNIYLEPRMDPTHDSVRRTNTIHAFGIDLMGTCDIFSYFGGFSPKNIEWINDSSCEPITLYDKSIDVPM